MSEDFYFGDFGKAKPESIPFPKKQPIDNIMYEVAKKRLEFDITSDRIRTAYFLLFDKSTRGTIKQIKRQIRRELVNSD